MALQFKKHTRKEWDMTELGTVASQIPGGTIKFTPGTIAKFRAKQIKSLSILFIDKKGLSCTAPLSKKASATIVNALDNGTDKLDCLRAILKLNLYEGEVETKDENGEIVTKTMNLICPPYGANGEEAELTVTQAEVKSAPSYEDFAY